MSAFTAQSKNNFVANVQAGMALEWNCWCLISRQETRNSLRHFAQKISISRRVATDPIVKLTNHLNLTPTFRHAFIAGYLSTEQFYITLIII